MPSRLCIAMLCVMVLLAGSIPAQLALTDTAASIETDLFSIHLGANAKILDFSDKAANLNYLSPDAGALARVRKGDKTYEASLLAYEDNRLKLEFGGAQISAEIKVHAYPHYIMLEVASVTGEGIEEFTFVDIPLSLNGSLSDPFTVCALALNLKTNVNEIPGPNKCLRAMCYPRFGMEGAKVALIACPQAQLRDIMKEAVSAADELPRSNIGGPWALDGEINRGSYLFDFGSITEQTVDEWIAFIKTIGLNQIDFHTGGSLRFGDCRPNPKLFPNGRASVKTVLDKLHAAGISAGLHTYAFFIAKDTPYVTPKPDPRLGKLASFTLAEALSQDSTAVSVTEDTKNVSTLTGFFVRNSVTLHIDDELITFAGVKKEPPFGFTECKRGACGTQPAAHQPGAKVHHLKECFGLFCPDADSTLLSEVAANAADTANECGFDMMYLDALDGEDILGGAENAWHYGSKFVFEIANRLKKPALFEMSTFHHHLWYVRARMGAWDHPGRSHKKFVDVHAAANQDGATMFLPMNMGWWSVQTWSDGAGSLWNEPTFSDDIEYLMGKCLANNFSISLMGVDPKKIKEVPAYQRLAPIFQRYEDLRHANYFSDEIKEKMRVPGAEFTLEKSGEDKWLVRPANYAKHKVGDLNGWNNRWTVHNAFAKQPARFRIEAIMGAAAYDAPEAAVIEDFSNPESFTLRKAEQGVVANLETNAEQVKTGAASGLFTASSDRPNPNGAWVQIGRVPSPPLSIKDKEALGLWVYGDGKGELLNIQYLSAGHNGQGGTGDHYINVDFTGWRYFELLELEGGNIANYTWPYGGNNYGIYRESVNCAAIESISLWYNNLPSNQSVACYLSPIKALPLVKTKVVNPRITLGGATLTFPVEMESGTYLEFNSPGDCTLYGPKGEVISTITPQGDPLSLEPGDNPLEFSCDAAPGHNPRAKITTITQGEPL